MFFSREREQAKKAKNVLLPWGFYVGQTNTHRSVQTSTLMRPLGGDTGTAAGSYGRTAGIGF